MSNRYDPETKQAYTVRHDNNPSAYPASGEENRYLATISNKVQTAWREQGDISSEDEEVKAKKTKPVSKKQNLTEPKQAAKKKSVDASSDGSEKCVPFVISVKSREEKQLQTEEGVYVAMLSEGMCDDVVQELSRNDADLHLRQTAKSPYPQKKADSKMSSERTNNSINNMQTNGTETSYERDIVVYRNNRKAASEGQPSVTITDTSDNCVNVISSEHPQIKATIKNLITDKMTTNDIVELDTEINTI